MGEFNSRYRGKVVRDNDPEEMGRIKINVHGIYDDEAPIEDLPWAIPHLPLHHHCADSDSVGGKFTVPEKGQEVWLFFEDGNHMKPVYTGMAPVGPDWKRNKKAIRESKDNIEGNKDIYLSQTSPVQTSKPNVEFQEIGDTHEITTISTKEGTILVIDHTNGKEKMYLFNKDQIKGSKTVSEFVEKKFERAIEGKKNESIGETNDRYVGGNESFDVKQDRDGQVDGTESKTILQDKNVFVGGDEINTIVGDRIEAVNGDQTETVIGNDTKTVQKNQTETVTKNKTLTILSGNYSINVATGDISITAAAGNISLSSGSGNITLSAPNGTISATDQNGTDGSLGIDKT